MPDTASKLIARNLFAFEQSISQWSLIHPPPCGSQRGPLAALQRPLQNLLLDLSPCLRLPRVN